MKHFIATSSLLAALIAVGVGAPSEAQAETQSPISLSLVPPIQIVPPKGSVYGFRLNIFGKNQTVHGLDIGFINWVDDEFLGVQFLGFGWVEGEMQGIQFNYVANIGRSSVEGGQLGLFNLAGAGSTGLQWGAVNFVEADLMGVQLGLFDYAAEFSGLQFGLVNFTENLSGVQIGLINIAKNGFLPVFPIVNFNVK
jgi:hypothetical protein